MTPTQLQALKANILGTPALASWITAGEIGQVTNFYNQIASPDFYGWKKSVSTTEVGKTVNYVAVEAMTDANRTRITTFYTMNPSIFEPREDIRTFWANTFSGALGGFGQATRDALEALWKRKLNNVEKLFATGTGTEVSPATIVFEGSVSMTDIELAMRS